MDQRRVRGQRNREALIHAAIDLFTANGYEATTVEQISAARRGCAARRSSITSRPRTTSCSTVTRPDSTKPRAVFALAIDDAVGRAAEASQAVAEAISEQPEMFLVRARMYTACRRCAPRCCVSTTTGSTR